MPAAAATWKPCARRRRNDRVPLRPADARRRAACLGGGHRLRTPAVSAVARRAGAAIARMARGLAAARAAVVRDAAVLTRCCRRPCRARPARWSWPAPARRRRNLPQARAAMPWSRCRRRRHCRASNACPTWRPRCAAIRARSACAWSVPVWKRAIATSCAGVGAGVRCRGVAARPGRTRSAVAGRGRCRVPGRWSCTTACVAAPPNCSIRAGNASIASRLRRDGRFRSPPAARVPGAASFTLRLRDARQQPVEDVEVPLQVDAEPTPRVLLLAGAPGPELKYLRRWARDAGLTLQTQVSRRRWHAAGRCADRD